MAGTAHQPWVAHKVKRLSHLDLPGAGQVYVRGNHAYVGHLGNKQRLGTTILDVSDPTNPRVVSQIFLEDANSQSHKARVIDGIMIVNSERYSAIGARKADELPLVRAQLQTLLGRDPSHAEIADKLGVKPEEVPAVEEAQGKPYEMGGFRIYDVSNPAKPKFICFQKTHGIGVHRFDMDAKYAYISTEIPGYKGNILVVYDIEQPSHPEEVSRWWLPGQHIAGGEQPTWSGRQYRLHHALRAGDRLYAGCWHGGIRVIDISDIRKPHTIGEYNYHPPYTEPSHTFMEVPFLIGGRQIAIAIDEEGRMQTPEQMERRRGRPHACLWVFDVTDLPRIAPLAIYEVSDLDSPWSRTTPGRLGAHQFQEHMKDTLVYCAWFAGGLRIVDIADPAAPREVGHFIPEPTEGKPCPQTNDVDVDDRGLIYIVDRWVGFDILEFSR